MKPNADVLHNVTAIVLAGGQGTRLYPLTKSRCKPAVAFGGKYRLIDIPLSNALNSGIRNIAVISQYFASHLNQHIYSTYRLDTFQPGEIQLISPEETLERKEWFKGTADAIRQTLDRLLAMPAEYFLILSGDQLYNTDLKELLAFAKKKNADMVIAALPVVEHEARRMGLLRIDHDQKILEFYEKPSDPAILAHYQLPTSTPQYLGSMGIYVFKRSALISLLKEEGDDFGRHLIPLQVKRGKNYAFVFEGYWEDIGTVESYYLANLALIERKNCLNVFDEKHPIYSQAYNLPSAYVIGTRVQQSILAQGSFIEAEEISHSIIGIRSRIGYGTVVKESIVLGKRDLWQMPENPQLTSTIGTGCRIEKAIIDEDTHIGNRVTLVNKQKLDNYDGDGIFIRSGIIIVPSGTSLPDGYSF